jgi:hypothetical protein
MEILIKINTSKYTIQYNTIQYLYRAPFHRDACSRHYLSKMFSKEPSLKKAFEGSVEFCGCPDILWQTIPQMRPTCRESPVAIRWSRAYGSQTKQREVPTSGSWRYLPMHCVSTITIAGFDGLTPNGIIEEQEVGGSHLEHLRPMSACLPLLSCYNSSNKSLQTCHIWGDISLLINFSIWWGLVRLWTFGQVDCEVDKKTMQVKCGIYAEKWIQF